MFMSRRSVYFNSVEQKHTVENVTEKKTLYFFPLPSSGINLLSIT